MEQITISREERINELEVIKPKIIKILKKHKASKAGIFGSYVRGEQKKKSDIDILVELNKELDLIDFIIIKNELENKLGKKVDLIEYDTIRKELKNNILREEIRII